MLTMEEALGLPAIKPPTKYKFYNGEVTLEYDDDAHEYTRLDRQGNVVIVPGVSSAVKIIDKSDALTQWAANQSCDYIREKLEQETEKFKQMVVSCGGVVDDDNPVQVEAKTVESWLNDARFNFQKYKKAAADTGKIAHDWVERHIKAAITANPEEQTRLSVELGELPDERAKNGAKAALDWMDRHNVKWVFTERKMYSRRYDYAGTADGLAYISSCGDPECCGFADPTTGDRIAYSFSDLLALIDWKTSNNLYVEYEYQVTAYLKAMEEEEGDVIPLRVIIRLGKDDGQFEARLLMQDTIERDFKIFLECLALYRSVNERKRNERVIRETVKAIVKAKKEADIAAEKARRVAERAAARQRRIDAKEYYKLLRKNGVSVVDAEIEVATKFGNPQEEEPEEIAA